MTTIKEEEIKDLEESNERFKRGLKVLATVAIGAGLLGFKLGDRSGWQRGLRDGYVAASFDFIDALKTHHEELRSGFKGD